MKTISAIAILSFSLLLSGCNTTPDSDTAVAKAATEKSKKSRCDKQERTGSRLPRRCTK